AQHHFMTQLDQLGTDGLCSNSRTQYANLHRNSLACFDLSCVKFHIYYKSTDRVCRFTKASIAAKVTLTKLVVVDSDSRLRQLRLQPFQAERLFALALFQ